MFRRSFVQKVLCSEGPLFRRSYVQDFFMSYVLFLENPMFRRSYVKTCSMFRRSLFGMFCVQKGLCSEYPIFSRSYVLKILVQKVLCSDALIFRSFYVLNVRDVVQETTQEARKVRHEKQKANTSCTRKGKKRGSREEGAYVKQDTRQT